MINVPKERYTVTPESQHHDDFSQPLTWPFILNSIIVSILESNTLSLKLKKRTELIKGKISYKHEAEREETVAFREWTFLTQSLRVTLILHSVTYLHLKI